MSEGQQCPLLHGLLFCKSASNGEKAQPGCDNVSVRLSAGGALPSGIEAFPVLLEIICTPSPLHDPPRLHYTPPHSSPLTSSHISLHNESTRTSVALEAYELKLTKPTSDPTAAAASAARAAARSRQGTSTNTESPRGLGTAGLRGSGDDPSGGGRGGGVHSPDGEGAGEVGVIMSATCLLIRQAPAMPVFSGSGGRGGISRGGGSAMEPR